MTSRVIKRYWSSVALMFVLLVVTVAYWPGLSGGFLFDDFANLPPLGAGGPVDNWAAFWRFITSGTADPTGRPLTLLTFLADAQNWPASPLPFKRTSLILHLINGVLLFALLVRLGSLLGKRDRQARYAGLIGCAVWLLHPLFVSTTLYIVQREAMLPATCIMTGLLLWLHGRTQFAAGKKRSAVVFCLLGLVGCTLLGSLAKANGALLPVFALLIESIVLARHQVIPELRSRRLYRRIVIGFGVLPALILIGYLVWTGVSGIAAGGVQQARTWTTAQRLMTEPRVLIDYLRLLWLPRPFSTGLFNDQYVASTSLLTPISTLVCSAMIVLLIVGAWRARQRHPALALAILFYFAGQLIESTTIPLELYYEHRNYLPALLMFWPVGIWLSDDRNLQLPKRIATIVIIVLLASATRTRSEVWGNQQLQALIWARINPNSARAQTYAALMDMNLGRPDDALKRLEPLLNAQPDQIQIAFNVVNARCMQNDLRDQDINTAVYAMRHTNGLTTLFTDWLQDELPVAQSASCRGLTLDTLLALVNAGLANPNLAYPGKRQDLIYIRGRIALTEGHPDDALRDFDAALDLEVRPGLALSTAGLLGSMGYPSTGLRFLNHYDQVATQEAKPGIGMPSLHAWVLARQGYWAAELSRMRNQLTADAGNRQRP